jgi:hypothetical protein
MTVSGDTIQQEVVLPYIHQLYPPHSFPMIPPTNQRPLHKATDLILHDTTKMKVSFIVWLMFMAGMQLREINVWKLVQLKKHTF